MNSKSSLRIEVIRRYLDINGYPAPYYIYKYKGINLFPKRVYIGKGTPDEIADALKLRPDEAGRIGIDCSGFVCQVLCSTRPITSIIRHPSSNPFTQLRFYLRPIEKTSVRVLIDPVNSTAITSVNQIQPWDLINIGDSHIMIFYRRDNNKLHYAHASTTKKRVITDTISLVNPEESIEKQRWSDITSLVAYLNNHGSGIVRLRRDSLT